MISTCAPSTGLSGGEKGGNEEREEGEKEGRKLGRKERKKEGTKNEDGVPDDIDVCPFNGLVRWGKEKE